MASPPTAWPDRRRAPPSTLAPVRFSSRGWCTGRLMADEGEGPYGPAPEDHRGPSGRRRAGAAAGARRAGRRHLRPRDPACAGALAAQPRAGRRRRGRTPDPLEARPRRRARPQAQGGAPSRRRLVRRRRRQCRRILGGGPCGGGGNAIAGPAVRLRRRPRLVRVQRLRLLGLGVLRACTAEGSSPPRSPRAPS